jgi:CubicO group peptidase (beta-lactamase class C family)
MTRSSMSVLRSLVVLIVALGASTRGMPPRDNTLRFEIDKVFSRFQKSGSPGCAVAVLRDGAVFYAQGYGMADLQQDTPIAPSTVFCVGSMAKQFTAMCIVLLVQQGKLALDDDIRKYISELPDYGKPITIANLVYHTSGLREQSDLLRMAGWRWEDVVNESDILYFVCRQKALNFPPGEDFLYSNTNYALLGLIVKRVSGSTLPQFADKEIFQPLGMTSTRFLDDHDTIVKHRAAGHTMGPDGKWSLWSPAYDFVGSSSLYTTVEDLARWDENFYTFKVGGPAARALVTAPGQLLDGTKLTYAFGLEIGSYHGLEIISHSGADPGYRAEMIRFPARHFSVIVLCNLFDVSPTQLAKQVADLFFPREIFSQGLDNPPAPGAPPNNPARPSPAELDYYEGLYWNEQTASTHRFSVSDASLQLMAPDGPYKLEPLSSKHEFLLPVAPRRFTFDFLAPESPSDVWRVRVNIAGQKPLVYVRLPDHALPHVDPAVFAGSYWSDELRTEWTMSVKGDELFLQPVKWRERKLERILSDVYVADLGTFRFIRDTGGAVIAMTVTTERTRQLRFTRLK